MMTKLKRSEHLPLGLLEVKSHLRIDHGDEDEYLMQLIRSAADGAEAFLGRSLLTQTFQYVWQPSRQKRRGLSQSMEDVLHIPLPFPPLIEVESVFRLSKNTSKQPIKGYHIDHHHLLPQLILEGSFIDLWMCSENAIEVIYRAGYGDKPSALPASIIQALLVYVADLYENRGSHGTSHGSITGLALEMLSTQRVMRLA